MTGEDGSGGRVEPLRIERASFAELPSVERVALLAEHTPRVALGYGSMFLLAESGWNDAAEAAKQRLIADLAARLPDHSVFDSGDTVDTSPPRNHEERLRRAGEVAAGTSHITVMKVIARAVVLDNADAIVDAARQFRALATDLMTRLAAKLGASPADFAGDPMFWHRYEQSGTLDAEWRYCFHGFECGFGSGRTAQEMDVLLGFPGEFGVLDPYFFADFVASTSGRENIASLFPQRYHDTRRALKVLEEAGRLRRVTAPFHNIQRSGVVAPDE